MFNYELFSMTVTPLIVDITPIVNIFLTLTVNLLTMWQSYIISAVVR